MDERDRFISSTKNMSDVEVENKLRPMSFDEYVGQEKIKANLKHQNLRKSHMPAHIEMQCAIKIFQNFFKVIRYIFLNLNWFHLKVI